MSSKFGLIAGVAGQGGACLAELPLQKGNVVHSAKRRSSSLNAERVDFVSAMPADRCGPGENLDLKSSHATPALMAKARLDGSARTAGRAR